MGLVVAAIVTLICGACVTIARRDVPGPPQHAIEPSSSRARAVGELRVTRVQGALAAMVGLWLLSFWLLLAAGSVVAATEGGEGGIASYLWPGVFVLSGPLAYWIERRLWLLLLPPVAFGIFVLTVRATA